MIFSVVQKRSFYDCLTEPPGFRHGEHQVKDIDSDIVDVKNIKCWSLDGEHNVITLEIVLNNLGTSLVLKSKVEKMLKEKYNAKYTSVSVDV